MGMREIWDQAKEIVGLALEQKTEERSAFVRKACGDDRVLLAEVESLLSNYDGADSLLENSPAANILPFRPAMIGKKIGAYRIVREIGQGGMAVVYLGERDDQNYRKQVAIKMVKPGIDTDQILHRFRNERQTLAALDHSNIVKLLDGGSTEDGLPYLVMEYVEGLPIDQYCDRHKLSIEDRLRLFRQVCSAVQYAHESLVIHRDLKPGNILIAKGGVPRLLDFGIAKLLNPECFQTPLVTRTNWHPMTPEYASPEQIRGQAITTASDVYSLGVLLFELLTGNRPYRAEGQSLLEMERLVCEGEAERPSALVRGGREKTRDGAALSAVAAELMSTQCGLQPAELQRRLRGDLDTITMKAIEKDPSRRYATASELSADIGRHLSHEPVLARPASATYRAGKYIRRHPVGVTMAAGVVLLLAGFAAMQTFQLRRITRERDRANWVTGFMEGMFKVSDPSESRGNSITAREILDRASKNIDTQSAQDPAVQAQMMHVMGDVYRDLGLFPRAQTLYERSAEIRRRILGPENSDTLRSVDDLAWILNQEGHAADAEKLQRQTVATRRRVFGTQNLDTLKSMSNLAWTLDREGNYAEAEKLEREVLDIRRRVLKIGDDRETAATMSNLAATLGHEGHYPEAEKLKRETLDIRRRILGPEHQETLTAMNNLAATFQLEGRNAEAEKLQRETLNMQRRILGSEHPDTLRSINNLAHTLVVEGRLAEAEPLQREALATKQRVLGPEHQDTLWAMNSLAWTLQQEGRYPEAEKLQRQTLEIQRRVLGPDRPNTLSTTADLAATLTRERQYSEAESLLRQSIDTMRRVLGPEHPFTLQAADEMVQTLIAEGRKAEAEKLARETLEIQRRVVGQDHPDTASTTYDLACVLAQSGRNDEALSFLREAIDHRLDPATDLALATAPELKSLRKDPRFAALVSYARQRAATQKPN
jgi:serine/threonine protein kinase